MKVHEALAAAFAAEGTTAVFGLMGETNMHWMVSFQKLPGGCIYNVRHEGAALAMANGWAAASGQPGVCTTTSGAGVAQLATSLLVASRASMPIVVFAGYSPRGLHHLDQRRFAEAVESGFVRVQAPDEAYDAVREAFYKARTESRPIILDAPTNVQTMEYDGPEEYQTSLSLLPGNQRVQPDGTQLDKAARIIGESKKPLIIAGRGATAAGAKDAILRLGDRIGALLSTTLLAKGTLSPHEFDTGIAGLFANRITAKLFGETDCVIAVGASMSEHTLVGGYLFGGARFIQIDRRPQIVMGDGHTAECYLQGDAKVSVDALERLLAERGIGSIGFRTPDIADALKDEIDPVSFEIENGTVDPRAAAALLDERLPAHVGVVVGGGHSSSFPTMMMNRPRHAPTIVARGFGAIGQGLPTAIGAAVASKQPVVLFEGDIGAMMHIQELDTAARHNLPLLAIIMNDEALGAEYHKLRAANVDASLTLIPSPDLGQVASAFGCKGHIVRSLDQLPAILDEFVSNPTPTLVDLRISRTVISVPYRRTHFGSVA